MNNLAPELLLGNSKHLWDHFYQIAKVPRPSHEETQIREHLIRVAEQNKLSWKSDDIGNLVIYVPGSHGLENRPVVIIQNHMDMVTVKTEDKNHDFNSEPLSLYEEDGWLTADRTTLGADNGMGCSAALALITDDQVVHPPLELLFTVAEETGLHGALALDESMLSGTQMLNLDGESWGQIYVGCAGGQAWQQERDLETEAAPGSFESFQLTIDGLSGGHSGLQIHQQLGNAIKMMVEWLIGARPLGLRLSSMDGGIAQNVLPRSATITFCCPVEQVSALKTLTEKMLKRWRSYLPQAEHELSLVIDGCSVDQVLTRGSQRLVEQLLNIYPHGAQSYNLEQPADLVDLSINLAVVKLSGNQILINSSSRFFDANEAMGLANRVIDIGHVFRLETREVMYYPSWKPDFNSPLLAKANELYEELYDSAPVNKAIHAGLECGILKGKLGEVDIVSFGPTIRGAHSPSEKVEIATVEQFWQLVTALLKNM